MVNENARNKELRKAITEIARSLEEISHKVNQANLKLDHLIQTYRDDRHAFRHSQPYDPFDDTNHEQ